MIVVLLIMTVDTDVHKLIVPSLLKLHARPENHTCTNQVLHHDTN